MLDVIHLGVEPEVDPGHDDEHAAGHVDGDEVVGELALEHKVHREAAVLAGVGLHVAVAARVALNAEPADLYQWEGLKLANKKLTWAGWGSLRVGPGPCCPRGR